MKNVIKKTCAIVMMTAVLFTAVAPTPVSAACGHYRTYEVKQFTGTSIHVVGTKACTIYHYQIYKVTECTACGEIVEKKFIRTYEEHTGTF